MASLISGVRAGDTAAIRKPLTLKVTLCLSEFVFSLQTSAFWYEWSPYSVCAEDTSGPLWTHSHAFSHAHSQSWAPQQHRERTSSVLPNAHSALWLIQTNKHRQIPSPLDLFACPNSQLHSPNLSHLIPPVCPKGKKKRKRGKTEGGWGVGGEENYKHGEENSDILSLCVSLVFAFDLALVFSVS